MHKRKVLKKYNIEGMVCLLCLGKHYQRNGKVYNIEQISDELCMVRNDKGQQILHGFHNRKYCKQLATDQRGRNSDRNENQNNFYKKVDFNKNMGK